MPPQHWDLNSLIINKECKNSSTVVEKKLSDFSRGCAIRQQRLKVRYQPTCSERENVNLVTSQDRRESRPSWDSLG